jgi:arsenate reductase
MKKRVIFICTHNAARSQMAEGLLRHFYGERFVAYSAGTQPTQVNPYAVAVMREIGVDISRHRAKSVHEFVNQEFDYVVTLCDRARQTCPFFPFGGSYFHRSFEDPSQVEGSEEDKLQEFRRIRDEIRRWLEESFGRS